MRKTICMLLALVLCLGLFAGCDHDSATPTEATETLPVVQDDGVLRVLLIGHSLGNDAMWMLPEVFMNEAPDTHVVLGFLYYSGCQLARHVEFAQQEAAVYGYMEFDSAEDTYWKIALSNGTMQPHTHGATVSGADPSLGQSQTSKFAIGHQDWDIVLTQGYPWEVTKLAGYNPDLVGNFNTLRDYVLANDKDPATVPQFGWNMVWTFPDDDTLIRDNDRQTMRLSFASVDDYYTKSAQIVKEELEPTLGLSYVIPSSTAYWNALSSYLTPQEMYRDYAHASEFGRAMIAYLMYCKLTGEDIKSCALDPINYQFRREDAPYLSKEDLVLTDSEKQILVESVTNALAKPYELTPSQYTEAPAE